MSYRRNSLDPNVFRHSLHNSNKFATISESNEHQNHITQSSNRTNSSFTDNSILLLETNAGNQLENIEADTNLQGSKSAPQTEEKTDSHQMNTHKSSPMSSFNDNPSGNNNFFNSNNTHNLNLRPLKEFRHESDHDYENNLGSILGPYKENEEFFKMLSNRSSQSHTQVSRRRNRFNSKNSDSETENSEMQSAPSYARKYSQQMGTNKDFIQG